MENEEGKKVVIRWEPKIKERRKATGKRYLSVHSF